MQTWYLWLSDLLSVQDEGCQRWLQRQKLQEDGPLSLQPEDGLHFSVYWTLPVSPCSLSASILLRLKTRKVCLLLQVLLSGSLSSSDFVRQLGAQSASVLLHLPGRHPARPRPRPPQVSLLSQQLVPP